MAELRTRRAHTHRRVLLRQGAVEHARNWRFPVPAQRADANSADGQVRGLAPVGGAHGVSPSRAAGARDGCEGQMGCGSAPVGGAHGVSPSRAAGARDRCEGQMGCGSAPVGGAHGVSPSRAAGARDRCEGQMGCGSAPVGGAHGVSPSRAAGARDRWVAGQPQWVVRMACLLLRVPVVRGRRGSAPVGGAHGMSPSADSGGTGGGFSVSRSCAWPASWVLLWVGGWMQLSPTLWYAEEFTSRPRLPPG